MTPGLIERLTEAQGPDRELDAEIALLVGYRRKGAKSTSGISDGYVWAEPGEQFSYGTRPPRYTESIDAALTLLPDTAKECGVDVRLRGICTGYVSRNGVTDGSHWLVEAEHKVPAIALCLAALRARTGATAATRQESGDGE